VSFVFFVVSLKVDKVKPRREDTMDYTPYLKTALAAASVAGKVIERFKNAPLDVRTKGEHYNLVTAADLACEEKIVETIRASWPAHNFSAEENKYERTDSPFTWVIDPIDGTANFAHGFPHFAVSIALAREGSLVLGVVLDPSRGELFQAVRGQGAALNGRPLTVSPARSVRESLLVTGFYYDRGDMMDETLEKIRALLRLGVMDIRRTGSAALDLCWVACGRVDGYFEYKLNAWDFAAGALILTEAGGKGTDWEGRPLPLEASSIAATNGRFHEELVGVLSGRGQKGTTDDTDGNG
jgi:myo-inositol-1(or 4)-monophosphatase